MKIIECERCGKRMRYETAAQGGNIHTCTPKPGYVDADGEIADLSRTDFFETSTLDGSRDDSKPN